MKHPVHLVKIYLLIIINRRKNIYLLFFTKNRENLIQDRVNQDELKEKELLLMDYIPTINLQKETLYSDLGVLYQSQRNDLIIDDDT